MRNAGAAVRACPHCDEDTPVYRSEYDPDCQPCSFSVCLWCEGFVEYDGTTTRPPFETEHDRWTAATREMPQVHVDDWHRWASRRARSGGTSLAMSQLILEDLRVGR